MYWMNGWKFESCDVWQHAVTSRNRQWRPAVIGDGILSRDCCTTWEENEAKGSGNFQLTHTVGNTRTLYKTSTFRIFQHILPVCSIQDRACNKVYNYSSATVTRLFPSYPLFVTSAVPTQNGGRKKSLGESRALSRFLIGTNEVLEIHLPWAKLTLDLQIFLTVVLDKCTARTWGNS